MAPTYRCCTAKSIVEHINLLARKLHRWAKFIFKMHSLRKKGKTKPQLGWVAGRKMVLTALRLAFDAVSTFSYFIRASIESELRTLEPSHRKD